jgi:hypothetical protein
MIITRRSVLVAATFGVIFSPGGAFSLASRESFSGTATRLRALVPSPRSALEIGRVYLSRCPEEIGTGPLTRLILLSMSLREVDVAALDHRALPAMLTSCVRADFEKGFTVEIGGWILSRTEARLCALWT